MIQEGQIKKSEAWEYYEEITQMDKYFKVFLDEFYNLTGHWLIRGTVINDIVWFDESERPRVVGLNFISKNEMKIEDI